MGNGAQEVRGLILAPTASVAREGSISDNSPLSYTCPLITTICAHQNCPTSTLKTDFNSLTPELPDLSPRSPKRWTRVGIYGLWRQDSGWVLDPLAQRTLSSRHQMQSQAETPTHILATTHRVGQRPPPPALDSWPAVQQASRAGGSFDSAASHHQQIC